MAPKVFLRVPKSLFQCKMAAILWPQPSCSYLRAAFKKFELFSFGERQCAI